MADRFFYQVSVLPSLSSVYQGTAFGEGGKAGSGSWFHNDPCGKLEIAFWAWAQG